MTNMSYFYLSFLFLIILISTVKVSGESDTSTQISEQFIERENSTQEGRAFDLDKLQLVMNTVMGALKLAEEYLDWRNFLMTLCVALGVATGMKIGTLFGQPMLGFTLGTLFGYLLAFGINWLVSHETTPGRASPARPLFHAHARFPV